MIKTLEVAGIIPAMKGMRNPKNSWSRNDTFINNEGITIIGENDLDLSKRLILAGGEHSKFMRQIQVWVDIDMPRYFWQEFDTYKFNTKNSCSTMHKLFNKKEKINKSMFSFDKKDTKKIEIIITWLNDFREEYLKTKDIELLKRAKRLLPEGLLQLRTVNITYAELRNMYFQRRGHKLDEWRIEFCNWIKTLPYGELITF